MCVGVAIIMEIKWTSWNFTLESQINTEYEWINLTNKVKQNIVDKLAIKVKFIEKIQQLPKYSQANKSEKKSHFLRIL